MSEGPQPDPPTPAQARLLGLLGVLAADEIVPPDDLSPRVVRTARWQRRVRGVAFGLSGFAVAAAGAVAVLVGLRGREER